jgi:hypothetical protein
VPGLILIGLACPLSGMDPVADPASAIPAIDTTTISAEQLLKRLPAASGIELTDGQVWWRDPAGPAIAFALVDPGTGNPLVQTAIGHLAVDRRLVADGRTDAISALTPLIAAAQAAQVVASGLTLREGVLTGLHLRGDALLVLPEGVARKVIEDAPDRDSDRAEVSTAVQEALAVLGDTRLDPRGRAAVETLLKKLVEADAKLALDEYQPSFARQLVRHNWADEFLPASSAGRLKATVAAASAFRPVATFAGEGLRLCEVKDAFGSGGWTLVTPTRTRYVRQHPAPLYRADPPRLHLVVDLPAGSDPLTDQAEPTAARLFQGNSAIASWNAGAGLEADRAVWRTIYPLSGKGRSINDQVANWVPPHVCLVRMDGDVVGLAVPRGLLKAPGTRADAGESARFLREAADLLRGDEAAGLPDAAVLDLLGQYQLTYVYDSPDSRLPRLVGSRKDKGDLHQTADQTVGTSAGGVMRGDCDDLSELYQAIAERQGRTAIVLQLPAHAACAWAERQRDQQWHVFVLQTGPALEFAHESLPEALRAAYLHFDKNAAFDPNGLGLLLRFSGENTRGAWRLSWRIFAEPDYCRTMIEVQRDWQYQTYQRGIHTMLRMIEAGDSDTANYRELAGLYSFTGQFDLAAEYHRKALAATKEDDSRVLMEIELLGHLLAAGQDAESDALAKELIESRIPANAQRLGAGIAQAGMELAGVLGRHGRHARAAQALALTALQPATENLNGLAGYIASPRYDQQFWNTSPEVMNAQHLALYFVNVATDILVEQGPAALAGDADLRGMAAGIQLWLDRIAFHALDEPSEAPQRYAMAAHWYEAVLGKDRFAALLAGAALPTIAPDDHGEQRIGGLAQLGLDLPWIKSAVPFWSARLGMLFAKKNTTLDRADFAATLAQLDAAAAATRALNQKGAIDDEDLHQARLLDALVRQDEELLRSRLRWVKDKDDKRIRDDTAQWIGDAARFMPIDWFTKVMTVWREELDYKPKWFWIAWRAKLGGANQHALVAAKMAADRYPEDPSFAEEYDFMRRLLEPPAK